MAKISAAKFTDRDVLVTGKDPSTGEYLSAAQRKALFRKRKVSSNQVFRKPGAIVKVDSIAPVKKDSGIVPTDKKFAIKPSIDLTILNVRVSVLEKQVSFLAKSLDKETELEKKSQKEQEKQLLQQEESGSRDAKEKQLERNLFKALISPVKAIGGVAKGLLGTLMDFFVTIFAGWLTDKGLKAFQAAADGNIAQLEGIKNEVLKALGIVGGIFLALNGGIGVILGIITGLAGKIAKFAWSATFGRFFRPPTPPTPPAAKPPAPTGPGGGGPGAPTGPKGKTPPTAGVDDATDAARRKLAQEVKDKGLKSKGAIINGKYVSVTAEEATELLKPAKSGFLQNMSDWWKKTPISQFMGKTKDVVQSQIKKIVDPIVKPLKGFATAVANKVFSAVKKLPIFPQILSFLKKQGINAAGGLGKLGKSAAGKLGAKALPFIGGIANLLFAYDRLANGDSFGAGLEAVSGILDFAGAWPLSLGLDAFLFARDFIPAIKEQETAMIAGLGLGPAQEFLNNLGGKLPNLGELYKIVTGKNAEQPKPSGEPPKDTKLTAPQRKDFGRGREGEAAFKRASREYQQKLAAEQQKENKEPETTKTPPAIPPAPTAPTESSSPGIDAPSSLSRPLPGPVSSAGNTTVIYKKIGPGGQMQQQPLKTGSATDVPLISSSNPSNFYTMYSQIVYNVVT